MCFRTKKDIIDDEIKRFVNEPQIGLKSSALDWWKDHGPIYPHLLQVAKCILCIPASSVPSERLFSKAGELVNKKRSALKPANVDKILFLNNFYKTN